MMAAIHNKITDYFRMIKFSHSVFALPFAFTSALIAAGGMPSGHQCFLIAAAMVGARSYAMGLNRIVDREIDRQNPRTAMREIPRGAVSVAAALVFVLLSLAVMVAAAAMLNPLCLYLSPVAAAVLLLYSYTKRFTWLAHFVLGISISAAPAGAWIAVRGSFDPAVFALVFSIVLWLAGFDVLYALQDIEFDRSHGLYSIPARFGIGKTLVLARLLHAGSFALLVLNGRLFGLGAWYWVGMLVVAGLFLYEHSLVKKEDLSRLNMAFFNMNGYISVAVLLFTALAVLL